MVKKNRRAKRKPSRNFRASNRQPERTPVGRKITYFGGANEAFIYVMSLIGGTFQDRAKEKVQVFNVWIEDGQLKVQKEKDGPVESVQLPLRSKLREFAGGPINQATVVAALGAKVEVFGLTGRDQEHFYKDDLTPLGVTFHSIEAQPPAVTFSLVTPVGGSGDPGSTLHLMRKCRDFDLPSNLVGQILATNPDLMVISSLPVDLGVLTAARDIFRALAAQQPRHCKTVFIPSMAQMVEANKNLAYRRVLMEVLEECNFVHMNVSEAARLMYGDQPVIADENMILTFATSLPHSDSIPLGQRVISVTRDKHGATSVVGGRQERKLISVPAVTTGSVARRPVVDPTGAGDIWIAIFSLLVDLFGFGRDSIRSAMTLAAIAARGNINDLGGHPLATGEHRITWNQVWKTWQKHHRQ